MNFFGCYKIKSIDKFFSYNYFSVHKASNNPSNI